jgi:hypothetical protein
LPREFVNQAGPVELRLGNTAVMATSLWSSSQVAIVPAIYRNLDFAA